MFVLLKNYIWIGISFQVLFGCCIGFTTYDFIDECENTLEAEAGELLFDAQKMPTDSFDSKCSVKVRPRSDILPKPIQVTLYFTKFDLSGTCEDMSVSVQEVSFVRKTVEGLPEHICGRNQSLEKDSQIFTTKADEFYVVVQRKSTAKYLKGNFTIKFIAFYLGKCHGSGVYNCSSNDHCISSAYECSTDINSCGDNGEHMKNCNLIEALTDLVVSVVNFIKNFSWIILLIIGLCVLKCCWKKFKDKLNCRCSSCRDCISDCCASISNFCSSISDCCESVSLCCIEFIQQHRNTERQSSAVHRNSFQLNDIQDVPRYAREDMREIGNDADNEISLEFIRLNSQNEDVPSDDQITPRMPNSPTAPPPSYDEVMASSYANASAPSYEDVVKNRSKYETKA